MFRRKAIFNRHNHEATGLRDAFIALILHIGRAEHPTPTMNMKINALGWPLGPENPQRNIPTRTGNQDFLRSEAQCLHGKHASTLFASIADHLRRERPLIRGVFEKSGDPLIHRLHIGRDGSFIEGGWVNEHGVNTDFVGRWIAKACVARRDLG